MSLPRVFVSRILPEVGLVRMREVADLDVWPHPLPPSYEQLREHCRTADGLVSLLTDRVDAALFDASPRLRIVSQFAVGFNNIDVAAATARGIAVGNTPEVLTDATADMAFTLMMAAGRRLMEGVDAARSGAWKTWEPVGYIGCDFASKTVGIVGCGRIGEAFARRCHGAFGMRVVYSDKNERPDLAAAIGAQRLSFEELCEQSDFISAHVALTPATQHLFNREAFARMRPTAVFVNTARGEIVDQDALAEALRSGLIFAAGLDVTTPEPLPLESPLLRLPNCIIVPHIASATVASRNGMAMIAAENLALGLAAAPLRCAVNGGVVARRLV